jgi:hypothetical protein
VEILTFFIAVGIMLWGVVVCLRHYFSLTSRFEDYFLLLAVINIFLYYVMKGYVLFTGTFHIYSAIFMQVQLLWTYWFLMRFAFKRNFFIKTINRRLSDILLTLFISLLFTNVAVSVSHIELQYIGTSMPLFMQVEYGMGDHFNIINDLAKLSLVLLGGVYAFRINMRVNTLMIAFCFIFLAETVAMINALKDLPPIVGLFNLERVFEIFALLFVMADVTCYFRHRAINND